VKLFTLAPTSPLSFIAGQHVDLRLTAPDGYQAQRSYSIASAPETTDTFELGIELMPEGEVSPFFHEVVAPGDTIEFRGPIGGHFNWQAGDEGPVLLVGGGSGIVPLMSILRHRANAAPTVPMALIYSVRTVADAIFPQELDRYADAGQGFRFYLAVTRERSPDARHHFGRIDDALVARALTGIGGRPLRTYVCGANRFVEAAARLLTGMGIEPGRIRTERFGGAD
jgi:ferredoxin-NADP reductase